MAFTQDTLFERQLNQAAAIRVKLVDITGTKQPGLTYSNVNIWTVYYPYGSGLPPLSITPSADNFVEVGGSGNGNGQYDLVFNALSGEIAAQLTPALGETTIHLEVAGCKEVDMEVIVVSESASDQTISIVPKLTGGPCIAGGQPYTLDNTTLTWVTASSAGATITFANNTQIFSVPTASGGTWDVANLSVMNQLGDQMMLHVNATAFPSDAMFIFGLCNKTTGDTVNGAWVGYVDSVLSYGFMIGGTQVGSSYSINFPCDLGLILADGKLLLGQVNAGAFGNGGPGVLSQSFTMSEGDTYNWLTMFYSASGAEEINGYIMPTTISLVQAIGALYPQVAAVPTEIATLITGSPCITNGVPYLLDSSSWICGGPPGAVTLGSGKQTYSCAPGVTAFARLSVPIQIGDQMMVHIGDWSSNPEQVFYLGVFVPSSGTGQGLGVMCVDGSGNYSPTGVLSYGFITGPEWMSLLNPIPITMPVDLGMSVTDGYLAIGQLSSGVLIQTQTSAYTVPVNLNWITQISNLSASVTATATVSPALVNLPQSLGTLYSQIENAISAITAAEEALATLIDSVPASVWSSTEPAAPYPSAPPYPLGWTLKTIRELIAGQMSPVQPDGKGKVFDESGVQMMTVNYIDEDGNPTNDIIMGRGKPSTP